MEPSSGNWNDCTSALRFVGHVSSPSDTVYWPGIVIRTSTALAPVLALRGGGAAVASAAQTASAAPARTTTRITTSQGSGGRARAARQTS